MFDSWSTARVKSKEREKEIEKERGREREREQEKEKEREKRFSWETCSLNLNPTHTIHVYNYLCNSIIGGLPHPIHPSSDANANKERSKLLCSTYDLGVAWTRHVQVCKMLYTIHYMRE